MRRVLLFSKTHDPTCHSECFDLWDLAQICLCMMSYFKKKKNTEASSGGHAMMGLNLNAAVTGEQARVASSVSLEPEMSQNLTFRMLAYIIRKFPWTFLTFPSWALKENTNCMFRNPERERRWETRRPAAPALAKPPLAQAPGVSLPLWVSSREAPPWFIFRGGNSSNNYLLSQQIKSPGSPIPGVGWVQLAASKGL